MRATKSADRVVFLKETVLSGYTESLPAFSSQDWFLRRK